MIRIIHRYEMREDKPQIVIYAYTPVDYEFAVDIDRIQSNSKNTASNIISYIEKNFSGVPDSYVYIIVNGIPLGSDKVSNIIDKK